MQSKWHIRAVAAFLTGVTTLASGAAATGGPAVLLPPDLDYAKLCVAPAPEPLPALDRDWTKWHGEPVSLGKDELYALASEYFRGSERVQKSTETALRILTHLDAQPNPDRRRLDRLIGRILIEPGRSQEQLKEGEARLSRALAAGETGAALDLALLYGPSGPADFRDPARTRALAQTAAASGDAEGKLMFATIMAGDPSITPEQKAHATEAALLSLVGEIVRGNCSYLNTIGLLYMRGDLVEADAATAIKWFEQAAETGDPRTQERLGDLISGPRVEVNDFKLALRYYKLAADQGRAPSALKVGQDFATGLVQPRDLDQARHYLTIAAAAGLRDGNLWLARLNYGNFGGTRDWPTARRYYLATLKSGAFDAELASEYGIALIENSAGAEDLAEAKALLTEAAYSGSGIAAVKVGELLLDEARTNPALYSDVETFMRLGDSLGRSEAARHMAELSLCAGPLFNPGAAAEWITRAQALGADALILSQGARLLDSNKPAERRQGESLIRELAMDGDAGGVGFALAHLRSNAGRLGPDPDLLARLEAYVSGNAGDPVFTREFDFAYIDAEMDLPDATDRLDASLATLDGYLAQGDPDAVMLKADLLKHVRDAGPEELTPLYQAAADKGTTKAMRELGTNLLASPG
ncbi:MAG TPA: tetratricopeptide repeat protein, partial [Devosia sp.]